MRTSDGHHRLGGARARAMALLAVVTAVAVAGAATAERPARADPAAVSGAPLGPDTGGPFGLHSMLQLGSPLALKTAMFAAAAAAGASEIRLDASLGALNNPWLASAMWQDLIDDERLSEAYGVRILLDLNASNDPALETCAPGVDPASGTCGVTDLPAFSAEIAALVRQCAGVIDDFEIVNEPDGRWAFSGTPQQYAGMLATAYDAVHANDPNGRVLLGGMMTPADTGWLAEVFATPGYDAAHKFDIANVHLRDTVSTMTAELAGWKRFFATAGDGGLPLWVTETGYPSDPAHQYDPAYRGTDAASGLAAQAAYLEQALPALVAGGAARVFVAERDNLGGQYASEGLLGGAVTDSDGANPQPVPRPALSVFSALATGAAPASAPPAGTASPAAGAPLGAAADTLAATPVPNPPPAALAAPVAPAGPAAPAAATAPRRRRRLRTPRTRRATRSGHRRPAIISRYAGQAQRRAHDRPAVTARG